MAPYILPMPAISIRGFPLFVSGTGVCIVVSAMAMTSFPGAGELLDVQVHEDREQQHHSEEGLEPVRVPSCVDDALGGHPEDEGADGGADSPVTAGQEGATDDRRDDVEELVTDALFRLHRVEGVQRVHPV